MKRNLLISYLKENKCVLKREGSNHSIFINTKTGIKTAVPRHPDIEETTVLKICKHLGIPTYKK